MILRGFVTEHDLENAGSPILECLLRWREAGGSGMEPDAILYVKIGTLEQNTGLFWQKSEGKRAVILTAELLGIFFKVIIRLMLD